MQTREMKREYEVAVLDPAGNVTAIVLSDVLAAERARIAAQLLRLPELLLLVLLQLELLRFRSLLQ